jgi:hypothetical protein
MGLSIAVIGSFKQHYASVLEAINTFKDAGWTVTSPAGSGILEPDVDFVRFETDQTDMSDEEVQSQTLVNIFRADLTYVACPGGYVGRTTCYELGRLIQARKPIFLSHRPRDLPVHIPHRFIVSPRQLVASAARKLSLEPMFERGRGRVSKLERQLCNG